MLFRSQMFGYDLKSELVDLKTANNTPDKARELFLQAKEQINDKTVSNFDRAVAFYVVNKCSFSGLTESSSFSEQASNNNFSLRGIQKLPEYSALITKWSITNYSYDYLMDGNKGAFMYLDPPYDIKDNLYGNKGSMHKGFDHDKFAADCSGCNVATSAARQLQTQRTRIGLRSGSLRWPRRSLCEGFPPVLLLASGESGNRPIAHPGGSAGDRRSRISAAIPARSYCWALARAQWLRCLMATRPGFG